MEEQLQRTNLYQISLCLNRLNSCKYSLYIKHCEPSNVMCVILKENCQIARWSQCVLVGHTNGKLANLSPVHVNMKSVTQEP